MWIRLGGKNINL
jgi:hypothetical protein